MWRVQNIIVRMGRTLTEAGVMLENVLTALDAEMIRLQGRLHEDAALLRSTVTATSLSDAERDALLEVCARIERTAHQVTDFVHRPDVDPAAEFSPPPPDLPSL